MPAAPSVQLKIIRVDDRVLRANIVQMARAAGKTVKEQTRIVFRGMLRDVINFTPPGSPGVTGIAAKKAGEVAIARDANRIGLVPVRIKGFRIITQAFGRPIAPVRVATRINPRFDDPSAIHHARMLSKHGGKVTRGGKQAYYVDRTKYTSLLARLKVNVGSLASGWARAAVQLGVAVPSWIARHIGKGRGTECQILETENNISMRVVNHFPDTAAAEAAQVRRLIEFIRRAAIGRLKRQLPYVLGAKVRAAKSN